MAPAIALVGVININYGGAGFQEKYFLSGSDTARPTFLTKLAQIAWGRSAFLAKGATIVNARVSSTDSKHDGLRCQLPYPVGPHPSWSNLDTAPLGDRLDDINELDTVFQMRFETSNGNYWQRYYHFPPDGWVTGKILNPSVIPYVTQTGGAVPADMSPAGGLSHLQVCQGFWNYLVANTLWAVKADANNYTCSPFQYITFAQVTDKKVGRAFGVPRGRRPKTLIS